MTLNTDRRTVLRGLGTTTIALAVAGCSSGEGSGDGGEGGDGSGGGDGGDGGDGSGGGDGDDGGDGEFVEASTVEMTDELTYEPKQIQVSAGTTVTWENVGTIGHTITAYEDEIPDGATYFASGGFESESAADDGYPDGGNVTEGDSYEHTFETTGTYEYYCIPHEMNGMVGTVEVV